jgi:uncharacterized membrane protein YgcG
MSRAPQTYQSNKLILRVGALLVAVLLTLLLAACASTTPPLQRFGEPVSAQRVYDRAGILTPAELSDLETRAAAVERAGAPTVVYLQPRDASQDETTQDGRDLMQAWTVESSPGARDGVVIFLNLQPDNKRHGEAAIIAGQKWNDKGILTDRENQRIYDDVVAPLLKDEKTAAGIAAGLDAISHDLQFGPPPPGPVQRIADFLTGWPLILLAGLLIPALIILIVRSPRRKKPPTPPEGAQLDPPDDLAPALAGALTAGRVQDTQLDATLLDFARRGVIAMEPDDDGLRVHVLQATPELSGYEQRLFTTISEDADSVGIISSRDLGQLRGDYNPARLALRDDMVARGWFAQDAMARRKPVFILAAISIVAAAIGFVIAAIAESPVGIGVALALFAVAIACFALSAAVPDTTEAGEMAALPWRTYQESLRRQARQPASPVSSPEWLDRLMPLAVALGLSQAFNPLLKAASAAGYSPAWLGWPTGANSAAFFPYWASFHTTTVGSGGYGGGGGAGASAGSSAGGGGF